MYIKSEGNTGLGSQLDPADLQSRVKTSLSFGMVALSKYVFHDLVSLVVSMHTVTRQLPNYHKGLWHTGGGLPCFFHGLCSVHIAGYATIVQDRKSSHPMDTPTAAPRKTKGYIEGDVMPPLIHMKV